MTLKLSTLNKGVFFEPRGIGFFRGHTWPNTLLVHPLLEVVKAHPRPPVVSLWSCLWSLLSGLPIYLHVIGWSWALSDSEGNGPQGSSLVLDV